MAGLYIHVPFCTAKCYYCDFYSGNQLYLLDEYVDAVVNEINLRCLYINDKQLDTIYFGGGTPSLLNQFHFEQIFEAINSNFSLSANAEISIECNPENICETYVDQLYNAGFNRISLGIQFLDDLILKKFNRNHSNDLIINALDVINRSKFDNLSIDLIYAVPGISDSALIKSLEQLSDFDIKHISAYSLTVAKNSILYWKVIKGEVMESSENCFLSQYKIIQDYCNRNSFEQYEVSNYAKAGYISRHNLSYWNQEIYLGVGVSAHSYNLISRQWNHTNIKKYIRELKIGIVNFNIEELSDIQLYNEYVILRLRTFQGLSTDFLKQRFSREIYDHFWRNIVGLMEEDHFYFLDDLIIPKTSDLLLADYFAKILMI